MKYLLTLLLMAIGFGTALAAPQLYTRKVTIAVKASDRAALDRVTSLARLLEKNVTSIQLQVRRTPSAAEALQLVATGRADLALADDSIVGEFQMNERSLGRNVSVVAALSVSVGVFIVPRASPAHSVFDLVGRRVAWSHYDTTSATLGHIAVDGLGLDPERHFVPLGRASLAASLQAMQEQRVDGIWLVATIEDLRAALERAAGRAIGFSAGQLERIMRRHPQLRAHEIPLGAGEIEDGLIRSVAASCLVVAHSGLSDEVAYRIAMTLTAPAAGRQANLRVNALATNEIVGGQDRIHPGARRRYEELRAN